MRLAMFGEDVLLRVIEVGLTKFHARVTLCARNVDWALMDAIVLEPCLEEDAPGFERGEIQGGEEGLQDAGWLGVSLGQCDRGVEEDR